MEKVFEKINSSHVKKNDVICTNKRFLPLTLPVGIKSSLWLYIGSSDQPLHTITSASSTLRPHWRASSPETTRLAAGWRWNLSCCRSRRIDWCLIQCQSSNNWDNHRQSECPEQPRDKQVNLYKALSIAFHSIFPSKIYVSKRCTFPLLRIPHSVLLSIQ